MGVQPLFTEAQFYYLSCHTRYSMMTIPYSLVETDFQATPGPTLSALMVHLTKLANGQRVFMIRKELLTDGYEAYHMSNGKTYTMTPRGKWQELPDC